VGIGKIFRSIRRTAGSRGELHKAAQVLSLNILSRVLRLLGRRGRHFFDNLYLNKKILWI